MSGIGTYCHECKRSPVSIYDYGERLTGAWAATFGGQLMALRRDYPTRIFGHCIKWRATILDETSARPACFIGHEQ